MAALWAEITQFTRSPMEITPTTRPFLHHRQVAHPVLGHDVQAPSTVCCGATVMGGPP